LQWQGTAEASRDRPALAARPGQIGDFVNLSLPQFVTPRYGSYWFAPGIDALTGLNGASVAAAKY